MRRIRLHLADKSEANFDVDIVGNPPLAASWRKKMFVLVGMSEVGGTTTPGVLRYNETPALALSDDQWVEKPDRQEEDDGA